MSKFSFDDQTIKVLANFANINSSLLIEPDKLSVISISNAVVATYEFPTPYVFNAFGLYDASDFLAVLSAMKKAQIEVKDKYLTLTSDNDTLTYNTNATDLVPNVPDVKKIFSGMDYQLEFSLPSDRLVMATKIASILKAKYMFLESDGNRIKITIGDDLTSGNKHELLVEDGIKINKLTEPVRIAISDFKVLGGEYEVKIAQKVVKNKTKYFSVWNNLNGVSYFIATEAVQ